MQTDQTTHPLMKNASKHNREHIENSNPQFRIDYLWAELITCQKKAVKVIELAIGHRSREQNYDNLYRKCDSQSPSVIALSRFLISNENQQ